MGMKNIIGIFFLLLAGNLLGQTQTTVPDTIVKIGGKKIPVLIKNVTATTIYYALAEKPNVNLQIKIKDVEKTIRKTGRIDIYNKPAFAIIQEGQWETVLITYNEKDVNGLYNRKVFTARSSPTKTKKKALENAIIKVQKQTANAGGTIALITHKEFIGGFGDNPGYVIDAIAYGPEPLEEGTNVVTDPAKKNAQSTQKKGTETNTKTKSTQPKTSTKK
jgi:hypothetical protein